jgi:hypothetical protein
MNSTHFSQSFSASIGKSFVSTQKSQNLCAQLFLFDSTMYLHIWQPNFALSFLRFVIGVLTIVISEVIVHGFTAHSFTRFLQIQLINSIFICYYISSSFYYSLSLFVLCFNSSFNSLFFKLFIIFFLCYPSQRKKMRIQSFVGWFKPVVYPNCTSTRYNSCAVSQYHCIPLVALP